MKRFVIERDIPGIGTLADEALGEAAKTSNDALAELAPNVQWVHSYVTGEKTFCIYLADSKDAIERHAVLSGFPANTITEVTRMIDPTTAVSPY